MRSQPATIRWGRKRKRGRGNQTRLKIAWGLVKKVVVLYRMLKDILKGRRKDSRNAEYFRYREKENRMFRKRVDFFGPPK